MAACRFLVELTTLRLLSLNEDLRTGVDLLWTEGRLLATASFVALFLSVELCTFVASLAAGFASAAFCGNRSFFKPSRFSMTELRFFFSDVSDTELSFRANALEFLETWAAFSTFESGALVVAFGVLSLIFFSLASL